MGYNKLTSLSANIKAIETAVAIHSQGRTATQEEKQVLAQYSGFGGIKDVLDLGTDKPLDKEVAGLLNRLLDALRTLAGGDEAACRSLVESIKSSVLTAFYTPQFLIDAVAAQIHKTFSANGLQMQSFLEPSVGIGGFLPVAMPGTRSYAFEKDTITGLVLSLLHEDATTVTAGFETIGAQETESIGGAALEELSKQVVAANGPAIDGVAGATVTTKAVRKAVADALGVELAEEAPADSAAAAPAEPAAIVPVEGGIQIGQAYAVAHGTKCFTEAVAVVKDDVILAAYLDDFQFTSTDAGVTAVPNSDSDFAAGYAEGKVLMSKRANADYYSKMMAEKGGSTVALDANFDAIQNFAVGKTISELEDVAAKGAEAVDAVSGATLVDTAGYLSAIVDAAKNAQTTQAVEFNGSSEDLKLNVVYGAAHGTKCFTSGAVATAGNTIVLSYIDEFQFAGSDAGVVGVPNSDSDFGAGYAEGKVLMSKRVNADYYSKMMAEKAGSTVSLDANYDAIQNHVNGMSIANAEALSKDEKAVDAVSGATLVDTAGYVGVLVDAAK